MLDIEIIIWSAFGVINFLSFIYVLLDKKKAINNHIRVPEVNFFLWGVFGGSLGILLGMYMFHHKTKKWYFLVGFSFLILQNTLLIFKLIEILK